jgi:WD40 repeat protein/tetratricopeptide (TPR) repeat protein
VIDIYPGTDGLRAFLEAYHATKSVPEGEASAGGLPGQALGFGALPMPAEHRLRPFPGLRSFEAIDSDVFFGRQEQIDTLLDLLSKQQVIAVLGGSGSGKSSVVRAGVIPALTSTFKIEGRLGRWYVAVCKPGQRPVDELCDAMWQQICSDRVLSQPNGGAALAAALGITGELRDRLMKGQAIDNSDRLELRRVFDRELRPNNRLELEGVLWFASDVLDRLDRELNPVLRSGAPSVMIVVDQFEELFGTDVIAEQRDDLLALLKRVFEGSKDKTAEGLYVTVTMRSEQLHRCAEFSGLSEVINGSMYLIELLDEAGLREAIVRPARRVFEKWGLPLAAGPAAPFDPAFVDRLLKESSKLRDSLVHKPDQLPLLQHALRLIWDNAVKRWSKLPSGVQDLTISSADEPESDPASDVGFLRSCLNLAADKALADAEAVYRAGDRTVNAEQLLRAFFIALARRDDRGNWARRLATWAELLEVLRDAPTRSHMDAPLNEARFEEALYVVVARGYLAPRHHESDGSRASYEVCHEALIRHWRRYEGWLEEADDTARALREVAQNLLSLQAEDGPLAWEDLQPYGYAPRDWLKWFGAVRERRAAGVVSEFNRSKINLVCGDGAKFGDQWALDQLKAFLRERDVHRGDNTNAEETFATEARELLTGIENATALVPPRLMWSGTASGLPRFVVDLVRHPDTRPFSLSGVVICGAAVLLWNVYQQQQLATQLHIAKETAAEEKIKRLAYTRQAFGAQSVDTLLADDQIELARLVAMTALEGSQTAPERKLRQSIGAVGMAQGRGALLLGTDASTTRIAVAPNGNFIAGVLSPASQSDRPPVHRIQLWDPTSGATIISLTGARTDIRSMAISPDAKHIAVGSTDGEISVWNVSHLNSVDEASKPIKQFVNSASPVTALAFSQDGSKLISGAFDRSVVLWDVAKGARVKTLTFDAACAVREAPDRPDTLKLPTARAFMPPKDGGIVAVGLNARHDRLLAGTSDRRLILWNAETDACLLNYGAPGIAKAIMFGSDPVRAVLAIDRGMFVTSTSDAEKFELAPLQSIRDDGPIRSIGFDATTKQFSFVAANGVTIATDRDTTTSGAGDSARDREINAAVGYGRAAADKSAASSGATARPSPDEFESIRFVPKVGVGVVAADNVGGVGVVAADTMGRVLVVQTDKDAKRPLQIVQHKLQSQGEVSFSINATAEDVSDDLRYVAVASDHAVIVRQLGADRREYKYKYNTDANIRSLGIDAAKKRLAIGFNDGQVQLWSFESNENEPRNFGSHNGAVNSVAFDKSGERMVSASDDRRATVWDLTGARRHRSFLHAGPVKDAKFGADDSVVTLSRDGALRRLDPASVRSQAISQGVPDTNEAIGVALDPSRGRALVLDSRNAIQIWDLRESKVVGNLQLPDVIAVGFWGETGEILTVWPSGDIGIWSSDAGRLRAYSNLAAVAGGWNAVNPTKRNVLTFDGTRDIKFVSPPTAINEDDVQAVVRAAVARTMTSTERQRYAPDETEANQPASRPMQIGLRCDPNIVEPSMDTVARNPTDAKAWFDIGCARENDVRRSGKRVELPSPSILVAAAMGHGPALASIGEWFASRKPKSAPLSSYFYRQAVLNDAANGARYLDWLVRWGDHTRDAALRSRDLLDLRANAGDPAAHFIRGMIAEGNARGKSGSPEESDELLKALFHFALADKLFKQRSIDEPTTVIRLGALARVIKPERVAEKLKEVAAWKVVGTSPPSASVAWTAVSPGTVAPKPTWRPDLTGIDLAKEEDLHGMAVSAIDALGHSVQLGSELDVLRAEYTLAQAKALGQNSARSPALLETARDRFEAELNKDDTDTRSFDRLDEVLATLAKMGPAGACDGARAARVAWFERWLKPHHLVSSRRLALIEAETNLGACFANAGTADPARKSLRKAAGEVLEVGELANLPLEVQRKFALLEVALADAYVQMGDRETAVPLYARPLIETVRGPMGGLFTPNDLQEMIRTQQKALAALMQNPATKAMVPPFADLADALRIVGRQSSLDRSRIQELYRGSIEIFKRLTQIEPDSIEPQLGLWKTYGQLATLRDGKDALKPLQDAVDLIKSVSERNPKMPALLRDVISSQRQLAEKLQKDGNTDSALKAYREVLATARILEERDSSVELDYWSNLYNGIGFAFEKLEDYRSAIEIYGQGIRLQPENSSLLNGRCWTRAIVGELEAALVDCDEAIRQMPDYANALDSRGFTHLKMGKFDKAITDYDAALKIEPGIAHSRYGRGLARLKSNEADPGKADIAAAKELNPEIDKIFERFGVQ